MEEDREPDDDPLDSVVNWTKEEVRDWLIGNGFKSYAARFCKDNRIDGKALLLLTENDLRNPPLSIPALGDIKHLMIAINYLQRRNQAELSAINYMPGDILTVKMSKQYTRSKQALRKRSIFSISSDSSEEESDEENIQPTFKPELWKTIVSIIYFVLVSWLTAIIMVLVNSRVPDPQTYPPLPDIFLDNVPLISWAFPMCEWFGIIMFSIWAVILFFHKHRSILLRRMCSLFGSVFLLRCVTMMITSLSVPGKHLICRIRTYDTWSEKLEAAFCIWLGGGMTLRGVRTCGDYMFSGHTVALTLLNFFITEYTPQKLYFLHTVTWVLNLFGIFFILAGHEHYSIDVVIAFYISSRLFLYYHILANSRSVKTVERRADERLRTRIWFPLFYFFESGVYGVVPNEYDCPVKLPKKLRHVISHYFV